MEYFRIHVTCCGKTGKPVGIFGACHHLKQTGRLTPEELKLFEETDAWYIDALPEPSLYRDGNPQKAMVWSKDTNDVRELVKQLNPLVDLLNKYGVKNLVSRTTNPGEIIYEDEYQVAVI